MWPPKQNKKNKKQEKKSESMIGDEKVFNRCIFCFSSNQWKELFIFLLAGASIPSLLLGGLSWHCLGTIDTVG